MDYFEYIDDYMNGELSGSKLQDFEAAMSDDSSLRKAVENYHIAKKLAEGLIEYEGEEILNKIKEEPKNNLTFKWVKPLSMAAAVILLVGMLWYFELFKRDQLSNQQFALNHFIEYGNNVRSGEVPVDSFERAIYYYNLNDFDSSSPIFRELEDEQSKIYLAYSAFKNGQYENVLSIISDYDIEDKKPIKYIKALSLIMLSRDNQAVPILNELSTEQDEYGQNASILLGKIQE